MRGSFDNPLLAPPAKPSKSLADLTRSVYGERSLRVLAQLLDEEEVIEPGLERISSPSFVTDEIRERTHEKQERLFDLPEATLKLIRLEGVGFLDAAECMGRLIRALHETGVDQARARVLEHTLEEHTELSPYERCTAFLYAKDPEKAEAALATADLDWSGADLAAGRLLLVRDDHEQHRSDLRHITNAYQAYRALLEREKTVPLHRAQELFELVRLTAKDVPLDATFLYEETKKAVDEATSPANPSGQQHNIVAGGRAAIALGRRSEVPVIPLSGNTDEEQILRCQLAESYLVDGDIQTAEQHFREAIESASGGMNLPSDVVEALVGLAEKFPEPFPHLEMIRLKGPECVSSRIAGPLYRRLVDAYLTIGAPTEAAACLTELHSLIAATKAPTAFARSRLPFVACSSCLMSVERALGQDPRATFHALTHHLIFSDGRFNSTTMHHDLLTTIFDAIDTSIHCDLDARGLIQAVKDYVLEKPEEYSYNANIARVFQAELALAEKQAALLQKQLQS